MRNLRALLLVLSLGLVHAQTTPAEVRDPTFDMLGPLLGLAAKSLSIDTSSGVQHIHLAAVMDGTVISEHDRSVGIHGDRTVSAAVTVAVHTPSQPGCPLQILLGSELSDESGYVFQHGRSITCLPDADVTRRLQSTTTPGNLLPGPSSLNLPLDQWLTLSAVRFGDPIPDSDDPLDGLIVFYIHLSTTAETVPPGPPGSATADQPGIVQPPVRPWIQNK